MKNLFATAAVLVATSVAASAMTSEALIKNEVKFLGFNAEVVESLSAEQIEQISRVIHNDNARGAVASLLVQFEG